MPQNQQTATRKHLYLITEHEDEERVGGVSFADKRLSRSSKNEETPIHKFDEEAGDFVVAGKRVSLGYVDFEDEEDYEENALEAMTRKLAEIDEEHLEKAGLDPNEVLD